MYLDVGDIDRIDAPTAAHVRQFLRVMPPQSPFVILSIDDDHFIQATFARDAYRVEYREMGRQWFTLVGYDAAVDLFERYRRGDGSFRTVARWRRLRTLGAGAPLLLAVLLLIAMAGVGWWLASR